MNSRRSIPIQSSGTIDLASRFLLAVERQSNLDGVGAPRNQSKGFQAREQITFGTSQRDEERVGTENESELLLQLGEIFKPLSRATTGREALCETLRRVVDLGASCGAPIDQFRSAQPNADCARNAYYRLIQEGRHTLRMKVLERLEESVREGELPENADVEVLGTLFVSFVIGLAVSVQDGIPIASLLDSVTLFVAGLGFHTIRSTRRRRRGTRPVLEFVSR